MSMSLGWYLLEYLCRWWRGKGVIYISSIEELQKIGNDPGYPLNGEYELTGDIDASGTINWDNGAGFKPIGSWGNPFTGKFNGKGYKIRKLYIYRPSEDGVGLFSYVGEGGEVRGVGLEDVYVVGDDKVGSLAGYNDGGMIMQCYSTGGVAGGDDVGGVVGENRGTIMQSYSTGRVSGGWSVGGLVGRNEGAISQCYSTGRVLGGYWFVGGLVGVNGGTVSQSYWDVETSGQSSSDGDEGRTTVEMKRKATYVGWDFGNVWDIVEGETYPWLRELGQTEEPGPVVEREISSLEELSKIGKDWDYPWDGHYRLVSDIDAREAINWNGGRGFEPIRVFTGVFDGNGHRIYGLYINRLEEINVSLIGVNFGEVRNLGLEDVYVAGGRYVGGLVGGNYGMISYCYSTGRVAGGECVGGLVGRNGDTILYCYSTVRVLGDDNVGGLVGENEGGTIMQCYSTGGVAGGDDVGGLMGRNRGTVLHSYSTGRVSGYMHVGGLVGWNRGGMISYCYSMGRVVGRRYYVGGLVGMNLGRVYRSIWDVETSGQSSSSGAVGEKTSIMKRKDTYVGWDFENVWDIVEGETYPWLRALGHTEEPGSVVVRGISSLEELSKIGRDWKYPFDGHYRLEADIDLRGTANRGDEGRRFEPIRVFAGVFDGNGHRIYGLYINQEEGDYVGLIGVNLGEVRNLGLEGVDVSGREKVGGLVGENWGTITQCYSMGTISGCRYVGGLVGENWGTILQSFSTGGVSGGGYVGGLVGGNGGTIKQCYSTSRVSGGEKVGGVVGWNNEEKDRGTIGQSYWDVETSGQSSSAGGEGKTTAEMKRRVTYVGWDFENVWDIVEGEKYPWLRAFTQEPEGVEEERVLRL